MAIGSPRGKNGMRPVYVYNPRVGRKIYVGSRPKLRGPGGPQELERQKAIEVTGHGEPARGGRLTAAAYAAAWLELHHGTNTRRPAATTRRGEREQPAAVPRGVPAPGAR